MYALMKLSLDALWTGSESSTHPGSDASHMDEVKLAIEVC